MSFEIFFNVNNNSHIMSVIPLSRLLSLPVGLRGLAIVNITRSFAAQTSSTTAKPLTWNNRQYSAGAGASTESKNSSVSHNEVSHFNALASSWWDPQGSSRLGAICLGRRRTVAGRRPAPGPAFTSNLRAPMAFRMHCHRASCELTGPEAPTRPSSRA